MKIMMLVTPQKTASVMTLFPIPQFLAGLISLSLLDYPRAR